MEKYKQKISIHAPREGGDSGVSGNAAASGAFQSTPPARGATKAAVWQAVQFSNFNPRPPRGGRQQRCTVLSVNL